MSNRTSPPKIPRFYGAAALTLAAAALIPVFCVPRAAAEEFEAVTGSTSADYVRARQSDGKFVPETYAFGKGGYYSGPLSDKSIDHISFLQVAHVMAEALKAQNYVPGFDPKKTKLLIMVYWGTTFAPEHASDSAEYQIANDKVLALMKPGVRLNVTYSGGHLVEPDPRIIAEELDDLAPAFAENRARDKEDALNAALLGYNSWWNSFGELDHSGTPAEVDREDMMSELEEDRYFVVLMAYDFQILRTRKLHKLLWDTRFSIREHKNAFDEKLPAMALEASRYFGKDSDGLKHDPMPEGHVEIGELRNLGPLPDK